ncbi:MAG: phosphatidylserine decarboxylase [Verrucomicrobiae bacterium]|nr:phosphatidylserine decarboxylase [Verrucomicrobiae bacterium]NNJ86736.1 phosphatidylserine decarboxylase [Akkermansiaceae bacterium]
MRQIQYFNRYTQKMETEQVYGEAFLKWAYGNPLGKMALHAFVKRPAFSKWYGKRMDQPSTSAKVQPFITDYDLDSSEFVDAPDSFATFNEFFYRKLKPSARPVADTDAVFPADGRHLGFEDIDKIDGFFVKGQSFDIHQLINDAQLSSRFAGGSLVLSRLCPVDYHRFHFPVSGKASETRLINGPLFSVSPIALTRNLAYIWQNKRTITQIETETMGTVLMLEIGATCVGSIQQTYQSNTTIDKGDEKGYFAFGGSSTITVFEPGKVQLADDLLTNSSKQVETYARMGDAMASIC